MFEVKSFRLKLLTEIGSTFNLGQQLPWISYVGNLKLESLISICLLDMEAYD